MAWAQASTPATLLVAVLLLGTAMQPQLAWQALQRCSERLVLLHPSLSTLRKPTKLLCGAMQVVTYIVAGSV